MTRSWKYDVNVTRIESRPVSSQDSGGNARFDFFVDFYGRVGDANVNSLLNVLKGMTDKLLVLDEKEVSDVLIYQLFMMGLCTDLLRAIYLLHCNAHV